MVGLNCLSIKGFGYNWLRVILSTDLKKHYWPRAHRDASMGMWRNFLCGGSRPSDSFLPRSEGLDHDEGAPTRFMVASSGVLSEGYGHGGPGVCLGDGQTEAEGVTSQDGRGDALLQRLPPYLT